MRTSALFHLWIASIAPLYASSSCIAQEAKSKQHVAAHAQSGNQAASGNHEIIEYYGDSTIWGYKTNVGGQVAKPAPAAFAEALAAVAPYDVRNEGVSGTTACDLLNGTDGKHAPWPNQMTASKARYVLVNFAINDQWKLDLDTYKGCLRGLAQTAKQHGKTMIFETPNPTRDSGRAGLDVYVNAMKEVAAKEQVPVIDQYRYWSDYLDGQSVYTICPDGLHPRDEIYVLKGEYAASVFVRLFRPVKRANLSDGYSRTSAFPTTPLAPAERAISR